jgi:hypothetical protein
MDLGGLTWIGPPVDDNDLLGKLPSSLRSLLVQINGFVLRGGALHVRGAVSEPRWHSLREIWSGPAALHRLYPEVLESDVPFAQDCVGDQFALRDGSVYRLEAETGVMQELSPNLPEFLRSASSDPMNFLQAHPLAEHGPLEPGFLLHAYPPFCTAEAKAGVSLRGVPAEELISWHAELSAKLSGVPDGGRIRFELTDEGSG